MSEQHSNGKKYENLTSENICRVVLLYFRQFNCNKINILRFRSNPSFSGRNKL